MDETASLAFFVDMTLVVGSSYVSFASRKLSLKRLLEHNSFGYNRRKHKTAANHKISKSHRDAIKIRKERYPRHSGG